MTTPTEAPGAGESFLDTLRGRRSRRFGVGMRIPEGPFAYASGLPPEPLSDEEEAALVFAACGVSGYALSDLSFGRGQGGSMLAGRVGRTIPSPDSVNAVALVVTNDRDTHLVRRPQDLDPETLKDLIRLAETGDLVEAYRRSRVKILDRRAAPPVKPGMNFLINEWSLYAEGGTYFLPVSCMTELLLNVLLEVFEPEMGLYALDERNLYRPAGVKAFARSRGGHLDDDPAEEKVFTIAAVEGSLKESVAVEQGHMLQSLGLMTQALGLGGFPNYARHPFDWFQALDFRMGQASAELLFGGPVWLERVLRLLGKDQKIPIPLGLERDGETLLRPYCPPYYETMEEAVHAFLEAKYGSGGTYGARGVALSDWRDPERVTAAAARPSEEAVAATVAYCEYVWARYGSFPVYSAPYRTVIGYQATKVDLDFYERFFRPEALTATQRRNGRRAAEGS